MPNTYSGRGCLSSRNSYYVRGCMPTRKRTRTRRARWCAGYVVRLLKVSPMSWLVVPPLQRTNTLPDITQLEDTFLRDFARLRPCRLSATLVFASETTASVRVQHWASILGCPSISEAPGRIRGMVPSWRSWRSWSEVRVREFFITCRRLSSREH